LSTSSERKTLFQQKKAPQNAEPFHNAELSDAGVDVLAVAADLEVEVGTRGCSGASDFTDLLACGYIVSDRNIDVSCMGIESGDSVAVIYYAVVAVSGSACVASFDRLCNIDDRARSGSADG
jgi:hypothetical protein